MITGDGYGSVMADRLDDAAIEQRLTVVPGWARGGEEIRRELTAPTFLAGVDMVSDVARVAEDAGHHPDIDIRWRTVTFTLTTHDAGGLTALDFDLAERIDAIAVQYGAD
jgi:4a-hydroxytetrahydrobiopterin dehydratase